jgi:hypothetical protein
MATVAKKAQAEACATYSYENTFRRSEQVARGHFVAQAFQTPDQGSADSVHVDTVKVVSTEFPVVFLALRQVIGKLQQCMVAPRTAPWLPAESHELLLRKYLQAV